MISPLDGNILEIYKQAGEWVQSGDPICRIVRMNRIRVTGFVQAAEHDPSELDGRPVTVRAEFARGRIEEFTGHVAFIALERTSINGQGYGDLRAGPTPQTNVVPGTGSYHVWVEVDNRAENGHWLLLPGSAVDVTIHLGQPRVAREAENSQR